jgi:hypothetical protein
LEVKMRSSTSVSLPNTLLRRARERLLSPTGSGRPMSRQELAEAVNSYLWRVHKRSASLDETYIGKLERGEHRWPQKLYREAFRSVLGVETDADLGFYITRRGQIGQLEPTPAGHTSVAAGPGNRNILNNDWTRIDRHQLAAAPLLSAAPEAELAEKDVLIAPAGRFFDGQGIEAQLFPAVDDGRILTAVPAGFADSQFLRMSRRGLVVGVAGTGEDVRGFGLDTRQARRRLARAGRASRLLISPAYLLDDLTVGILWAVVNLDEPLLNDDGLLADLQQQLVQYDSLPSSSVGRDVATDLANVSQMWLGSDFCARHILRHLVELDQVPEFWTREQRGEEASNWLLFRHKYDYLQAVSDRFAGGELSRGFCIPSETITASPPAERTLLLLAVALMESFGIRVNVCADPEYTTIEGFVLDRGRQAIVANWVDADGIWHVGVAADRPTIHDYGDVAAYTSTHSVIAGPSPAQRLRELAEYLDLDWPWLVQRCGQLGEYGCAGFAEPRSRLLSLAGVDRACRYLARSGAVTG